MDVPLDRTPGGGRVGGTGGGHPEKAGDQIHDGAHRESPAGSASLSEGLAHGWADGQARIHGDSEVGGRLASAGRWGEVLPSVYVESGVGEGAGDLPFGLLAPSLGEGPHLGYAVQWFVFFIIGLIGYPLVLVRLAREDPDADD